MEGGQIMAWKKNNGKFQRWTIVYVDQMKEDSRHMVDGFRVDTPFYIRSRMPMRRVIGGTSYVYM
jgi:hypothetical protein